MHEFTYFSECIKATDDDVESLRVSEDISASSSTGQVCVNAYIVICLNYSSWQERKFSVEWIFVSSFR